MFVTREKWNKEPFYRSGHCLLLPSRPWMTGFPDVALQSTGMPQCQRGEHAFLDLNQHDGRKWCCVQLEMFLQKMLSVDSRILFIIFQCGLCKFVSEEFFHVLFKWRHTRGGVKIPLRHRGELTLTFWVNSLPHLICLLIGVVKFLQSDAHMHLGHMTNSMGWVPAMSKKCLIWTLNRIRIDPLSNREQCFWLFGDWQYTCLAKFRPCVFVYIHLWQSLHNPICPVSVFILILKKKWLMPRNAPWLVLDPQLSGSGVDVRNWPFWISAPSTSIGPLSSGVSRPDVQSAHSN